MSLFDGTDIIELITSLGNQDATFGGSVFPVIFNPAGKEQLDSGEIVRVNPYVLAEAGQVTTLGISAGNDGDSIVIGEVTYTVLAIDPDGAGMSILSLEEA